MTDLEGSLRALSLDWPPTPDIAARLELAPRRRRSPIVVALAAAALAAAFAVPSSRSAILRFFDLGGVTVERVGTLPTAQARPLAAELGSPVGTTEAATLLGAPFRPVDHGQLYERGGFVSTLLATPQPALLSEFGSGYLIKKLAVGNVESVEIDPGVPGLWLGGQHVVFFPGAPPRLAGNVLVWASGGVTFRLEAPGLDEPRALAIAREIIGTTSG